MPELYQSETFEQSSVFQKHGPKLGWLIALGFGAAGVVNYEDKLIEYQAAQDSAVCQQENSEQCEALLDDKRKDALLSGVGGVGLAAGLGYLTIVVSRREEQAV